MKFRKLPPLHVLHTFEVAAGHLSFRKTAELLSLTPSAVSHQMNALEEFLGTPLFERKNRSLRLTPAGLAYQAAVGGALEQLRDATDELRTSLSGPKVTLSVAPFISAECVMPSLQAFQARFPGIDLRVVTEHKIRDLRKEDVDIALRLGDGNWPGVTMHLAMRLSVVPVCAPGKLIDGDPIQTLRSLPLLGISPLYDAWEKWLQWAGLDDPSPSARAPSKPVTPKDILQFDNYSSLIGACEHGVGVAFGLMPLLQSWIDSGRLIQLWPSPMPIPLHYYILYRTEKARRPEIMAVEAWLQDRLGAFDG